MNRNQKKCQNTSNESFLGIGKMPPQNTEAEEVVLGALIIEPEAIVNVSNILKPEMFYKESHQLVYKAITNLYEANKPIDMITVVNELRRINELENVGGAFVITQLTSRVASAANIEFHALMIFELYVRRNIIMLTVELNSKSYDDSIEFDDVFNCAVLLSDNISNLSINTSKILNFKDGLDEMVQSIIKRQKNSLKTIEMHPSLKSVRKLIKEWEEGQLIIIAGRPGMGKSSFVLYECISLAKQEFPILIFSLEMTAKQLIKRAFLAESNIPNHIMDSYSFAPNYWDAIDSTIARICDYPVFIDDTPLASFAHIKTKSKLYQKRHGIKAIAIDYLQLMDTDKNLPREQQISTISRQLKSLAKELKVPIFLLSQLNRNADSRSGDGFKPKLSDLRESGAIEQDADIVLFPYRPEYYYPNDSDLKGTGLIIVAKNREGKVGECNVEINEDISRWTDVTYDNAF